MAGIGGVFGQIGGAVADFGMAAGSEEASKGDFAAAVSYTRAQQISQKNEQIAKSSTEIQQAQLARKVEMAVGTERAQTAGANLEGGSAGDLLRMSVQQGALAKTLLSEQGQINVNAYAQQSEAYGAMASSAVAAGNAAAAAAAGQQGAGIFNLIGAGLSLFSLF